MTNLALIRHNRLIPYYRARYYSPGIGRFLSRDRLRNAELRQGPNFYWYVQNNSVKRLDPLGQAGWTIDPSYPPTFLKGTGWKAIGWEPYGETADYGGKGFNRVIATYSAQVYVHCVCKTSHQVRGAIGTKTFTTIINLSDLHVVEDPSTLVLGIDSNITDIPTTEIEEGFAKMAADGALDAFDRAQLEKDPLVNELENDLKNNAPQNPNEGTWVSGDPCAQF